MSSGTRVSNKTRWITDPNGTPHFYGVYQWKQWSGADSPNPSNRNENWYNLSLTDDNNPYITWRRWGSQSTQYGNFGEVHGYGAFTNGFIDPWTSNDDLKMLSKLGAKARRTDFEPAVFLGTGMQTLDLLAGTATTLYKSIKALKRGRFADAAKALGLKPHSKNKPFIHHTKDELSARWLELQYGWLPLVEDTFSLAEAIANTIEKPMGLTIRTGKEIKKQSITAHGNYINLRNISHVRKGIIVHLKAFPHPFELTLVDPALVAWEAMPWSFVLDWVIPIGTYLEAQKAARLLDSQTSLVVTSLKRTCTRTFAGYTNNPINGGYTSVNGGESSFYRTDTTFSRSVSTQLPSIPLPRPKPLEDVVSFKRCLNAFALLAGLTRT